MPVAFVTVMWQRLLKLRLPPVTVNVNRNYYVAPAVIVLAFLLAWLSLNQAVFLVGGLLFLGVALLKPVLSLGALVLVIPFSSLLAMPLAGVNVGGMELLLLLLVGLWLLKIFTHRTLTGQPFKIYTGPLLWPFVIFLGGIGLSWLNAVSLGATLVETIKWVEMFVIYLIIINLLDVTQLKWLVGAILLAGVAQALLGLYQFIYKVGPEGFLLFGGRFLRAYGTFAQPNPYGGYLGLALPLALSLTLWGIEQQRGGPAVYWSLDAPALLNRLAGWGYTAARLALLSLPLMLMLAALFASQSRGAWLGFAVAALVTVMIRSKRIAILMGVVGLVGALLLLAGSFDFSRLTPAGSDSDGGVYQVVTRRFVAAAQIFQIDDVATVPVTDANFATLERLAHWQAAREMWRDALWLGVGFGNYAVVYPAYAVGRWQDPLGHAHNYLLNLGAESGLVGLVGYFIFWILAFRVSWVAVYYSQGFTRAVAAGGAGILAHLHMHNMVDNLFVQGMYLHVAIVLGMLAIIYSHNKS